MPSKRPDGRFQKTKRLNGRKIFGYGETPELAQADLNRKLSESKIVADDWDRARITLHDFSEDYWLPTIDNLAPTTITRYEGAYRNHIRMALGGHDIRRITPSMIHQWAIAMANNDNALAANTIDLNVAILKQILRLAEDLGIIAKSPAVRVPIPKRPAKRERMLSLEQAAALLAATDQTPIAAPVYLAMVCGLRRGEISGLKWTDLDRQKRELRILRQRVGTTGQNVVERELKTSSSRRTLHLPKSIIEGIDRRGDLDSEYMTTYRGRPWVPDTIGEKWAAIKKPLGLGDWHFHDLRHLAGGLLAAAGANLLEIAAVLGHSKPDMSLLYVALRERQTETAFERLDILLNPKSD